MILAFKLNPRTFLTVLSSQSIMSGKKLSAELCFHQSGIEVGVRETDGQSGPECGTSLVLSAQPECWVIERHVYPHEKSVHLH